MSKKAKTKNTKKPQVKAKTTVSKSKVKPVQKKTAKPALKKAPAKAVLKAKAAPKKAVKPAAKLVLKKAAPVKAVVKAAPAPQVKAAAPVAAPKLQPKPVLAVSQPMQFKAGDFVVYPTHGVGKITGIEAQQIGEIELKVFVIAFEKDKMILRVPVNRAAAAGLRHVSSKDDLQKAYKALAGKAKIGRGMWSRRAQEYETKINSGNIVFIAEVVRDLHRNVDQAERSYSERMIYESALGRLVGELAASEGMDAKTATDKLIKMLRPSKSAEAKNEKLAEAA